jgi:hypothetical protein
MQPDATLPAKMAATQSSQLGSPTRPDVGFSEHPLLLPIRHGGNGADTMKVNDLREIGFVWQKNAEPPCRTAQAGSAQPTPLQPDGFRVIGYESDLQGGGVIAGVGQRLLDITSRFPIKKFFEKLTAEAAD